MVANPLQGMNIQQIAELAKKKGASQQQIQSGYNAIGQTPGQTPPAPVTPPATPAPNPTQGFANPFSSGEDGDIAMAGRKAPTVATPSNPVVNTQVVASLPYDPQNPEDYLLRTQAKAQSGGKLSEEEYYNALQAQRALQQMQINTDPFAGRMEEFTAEQARLREEEKARDTSELGAYKTALEAQYGVRKDELLQSATRQKESAQGVMSFSGFGRSTAAADTMVQIQKDADNAINAMNAAMQAEIARKEAELAGADGEALQALDEQIAQYRAAATEWQIGAIKATQEANQAAGTSYMEAINNLMTAASGSGIELGDAKNIQEMATLARNADGSINEEFVSSLPADIQAVIRSAAMTSQGGTGEAADTISIGSGKSERVYQRNPETNRYDIPVGGSGFGGGGGGGGGAGGSANVPLGPMNADLLSNLYKAARSVANSTVRSSGLLDPDAKLALSYITSNLTLEKITDLKKNGVSLGALSEGEWAALASSIGSIGAGNSKDVALEQLNRMIRNAGGIPLSKEDAKKGVNPIAPTTPNTPTPTTGAGTVAPTPTTIDDLR